MRKEYSVSDKLVSWIFVAWTVGGTLLIMTQ